jgi:hypothetical protein
VIEDHDSGGGSGLQLRGVGLDELLVGLEERFVEGFLLTQPRTEGGDDVGGDLLRGVPGRQGQTEK